MTAARRVFRLLLVAAALAAVACPALRAPAAADQPTFGALHACGGGAVPATGGRCVCPAGTMTYREASGLLRCVAEPVETCIGDGQVVDGKCVCGGGDQVYRDGSGSVRCIKPAAETCLGDGQVVDGKCVCGAGDEVYRDGSGAVRCIKPAADVCVGAAHLVDGKCVCPAGQATYRDGNGVVSCLPTTGGTRLLRKLLGD